ncbi:MAG: sulfotransferase [Thermogutta sp.]|nr:sulfotransferase [Thermogutta sp.]
MTISDSRHPGAASPHPGSDSRHPGADATRPRVVFILGTGRSGSTVLDLLLGAHPDIQGVGELCNVVRGGWIGGQYCSCGRRTPECDFWQAVREQWRQESGGADPRHYEYLLQAFEQRRLSALRLAWTRRPDHLTLPARSGAEFRDYAEQTAALFRAIAAVSGRSIIVDSSKNPVRALALLRMDRDLGRIDLRLIHLVRDVRGFAWSNRKSFRKDEAKGVQADTSGRAIWRSALAWVFVNLASDYVRRGHDRRRTLLLKYEDLTSRPENALQALAGVVGVTADPWLEMLHAATPLRPGHVVAGNRVRMEREIRLRPDLEWQSRLSPADKRVCWMLAGWKAALYGYPMRPDQDRRSRGAAGQEADPPRAVPSGHPIPRPHFPRSAGKPPIEETARPPLHSHADG